MLPEKAIEKLFAFIVPEKWDCYKGPYPKDVKKDHIVLCIAKEDGFYRFLTVQSSKDKDEKIIQRGLVNSLVTILKEEWPGVLTKDISYMMCSRHSIVSVSESEFEMDYKLNKVKLITMPSSILDRVKKAIQNAPTFTENQKKAILG